MKRTVITALLTAIFLFGLASFASADMRAVKLNDAPTKVTVLDQSSSGVTLELNIGEVRFLDINSKEGMFTMMQVDGLARSFDIGNPNLPEAGKLIAIPVGCELRTEIIGYEVQEIDLNDLGFGNQIIPAQPSLSKSDDPEDISFEMNFSTYGSTNYYSVEKASSEILGMMRNIRVGRVAISPFEYNPTENKLRVFNNIIVEVSFDNADWNQTEEIFTKHYSPVFDPLMKNFINNENFNSDVRNDSLDLSKYPIKYLIVSDRMFEAQLAEFVAWKTLKGFNVEVAYTDIIGSSNTAISGYIETMYNNGTPTDPAPSFVLLVGDAEQIPPFSGTAGSHVTDLYFCEYTGDLLPEIYYGRFSAQTTAQLQPQIDKTLEYEKYLMPDPSYLEEVTLVAGVDGTYAITHGNGQINYGTDYYFNTAHGIIDNTWLYPASSSSGVSAAIIDTINDGVSFHNYTAHCSHSGQADPSFTTSDVPGLTNYDKYFLGVGNCCLANTFAESTPCFGEALLQIADKGAIGYIGASNSTYWDEDYFWGVGYGPVIGDGPTYEQTTLGAYDGVFHDQANEAGNHSRYYVTNDAIIFAGNLGVSASSTTRKAYYWEAYHLMGDPSCMTYMGVPSANNINHSPTVLLTAPTFTVDADPGSLVGISVGGVLHGTGYIDESGSVVIDLDAFASPGTADIVITAQNRQPYIGTIQIIAPDGPFVVYDEHLINDLAGNNDGIANCGESVTLDMQLMNVGPDTAFSVTATISSTDAYITITDDNEAFGNIEGDFGTINIADAFAFDIAGNCPDGHEISFDMAVTGSATRDTTWTSAFKVTVASPAIGFLSISIDDATGNNNGILDPGETADITVNLNNDGSADGITLTATLSETDANVSVSDDIGSFGTIIAGGTGDNAGDLFTVSADPSCPLGYLVQMNLAIVGDGGYYTTVNFNLTVGDRVVFYWDDFSFDQGWTGLGGSGEWTIGACVGGTGSDGSGGPDPSADHSPSEDNYVLGNDLTSGSGGDYASGLSSTYWISSPIFDLSSFSGVQMKFWRWLGIESSSYDHAYFQVYDGSAWVTLYESGATSDDQSWIEEYYDLGAYADGNVDFQFRFGIGSTDGSVQYCGWNIDDIELKGYGQVASGSPEIVYEPTDIVDSLNLGEVGEDTIKVYNTGEVLLRVRFSTGDAWIAVNSEQQTVAAGDSLLLPVSMNTSGLTPGNHVGAISFTSNDPTNTSGSLPVNLHIYSPDIAVSAVSIDQTAETDTQTSQDLIILNNGPGRLEYDIARLMFNGKSILVAKQNDLQAVPLGSRPADAEKGDPELSEHFYPANTKDAGGPDAWGYNWVDSDEPNGPVYEWIDISTVGTAVVLVDDDTTSAIPIGFGFPFYENYYSELYIGSNGIVTFGSPSRVRTNVTIPTGAVPNNMVALWWDDLDPEDGGMIYYYHDATNERFIVTFDAIPNYSSSATGGALTFQAIFTPNGQIKLQYGTMDPGEDYNGLAGATIGMENSTGTDGLEVNFNADYVHADLAVLFTAASWLSVDPGAGSIDPFSADTIAVNFDATDMSSGEYAGQLSVGSNDPDTPNIDIPVSLTVTTGAQAPTPPNVLYPGDGAIDMLKPFDMIWSTSVGATNYRMQISTDQEFATYNYGAETADTIVATDAYDFGDNTLYYWRIQAENGVGWGEWCTVCSFTTGTSWICGDANNDGLVNIIDITFIIAFLYQSGPAPLFEQSADINGDGAINIIDVTELISVLYSGAPDPTCGL